jgi:tRNA A-37 threonylcarbamoyl transferase component Bud32/tetratricopeptide (TPR) repeat protein
VTDLQSRVASQLSGTYTLERELGGGGMSRVFVAEETALGRKVVVKVMSPELAERLSTERFIREIKVAARLQQANIVPVLRAGELDGLPFYTMPFVTGESLRARMTRGPLETKDAVGVLRDVAKALAYAHGEGIIHRDIKPENVLLSAGTAVVTDFGIAKAISESRQALGGDVTLTSAGTSLGTPAYMAPEQAAGDPNTDSRADVYSWGVMAYELLSGQHPFPRAKSPHDLIRAHMAEEPEHVGVRAPSAPMAVSNLVMRCLAKIPDGRPASAAELASVLEGVQDGSAGPAVVAKPLGVARAIGAYAAAFVVVALLARLAISVIGLPAWVFPGALGVMVVGLPVVLVTALLERQRHVFHTTSVAPSGTLARIAIRSPRQFTWRRTVLGGGVALGTFIATVAAYMAMRQFGIGPFGTLIGSNTLAARDRVVIADMRGTEADSGLGAVFAEGLRAGLAESKALRLIAADHATRTLELMQRPGASLTGDVARDVATRTGAKAILDGNVRSVGASYALTVRLLPVAGGEPMVTLQETAANDADFTSATGRLAKRLRERIGESLRSINAAPELSLVTTASLPALRKYTEGVRAQYRGDFPTAFRAFREAVAIDSGFASAYSYLGVLLADILRTRQAQSEMLERAYAMRNRATPFERASIEVDYWWAGPNPDHEKMKAAADVAYGIDPERGAVNKALSLYRTRDYQGSVRVLRELMAIDSTTPEALQAQYGLALAYGELGHVDSAITAVNEFRKAGSAIGSAALEMPIPLLSNEDSIPLAIAAQFRNAPNPFAAEMGATVQRALFRRAGRLRESWEAGRFEERGMIGRGVSTGPGTSLLYEAIDRALFLDDRAGANRLIDSAQRILPQASLPPRDRYTDDYMMAAYFAGRPELIRPMIESLRRDDPRRPNMGGASNVLAEAESYLALLENRYADALEAVRRTNVGVQPGKAWIRIAKVFDKSGQADSALHYYERYVRTTSFDLMLWSEAMDLAFARRRLAQLYEDRKEYTKAYEMYAAFAHQWRNADPELQPLVRSARARVAALEKLRAQ